jgi:hypothetical protein
MPKIKKRIALGISLLLISFLLVTCTLPGQEGTQTSLTAVLNEVQGNVEMRPDAESEFQVASNGQILQVKGQVITYESARARIDLSSGTIVRLAPLSSFTLESINGTASRFKLDLGQIWIILKGGSLDIDTPSGLASVRGSYMGVVVDLIGGVRVTCLEGNCLFENNAGQLRMVAGQAASANSMDDSPVGGMMDYADALDWMENNPGVEAIMPAVTKTVQALNRPDVILPELACLQDNTCATYCAPPGWSPVQEVIPDFYAMPQDCQDAALSLLAQGVVPEQFIFCVLMGGDPQLCANAAVNPE